MDAVAAAHADRLLVLKGAFFQCRKQVVEIGEKDIAGLGQLYRETGIEHVRGGHALVQEARRFSHMLGHIGKKGDDVVLGFLLDFIDARHLEAPLFPHRPGGVLGDDAQFGLGVAGVGFDFEPYLELVFGFPDSGHFGPGIAWNHLYPRCNRLGGRPGEGRV